MAINLSTFFIITIIFVHMKTKAYNKIDYNTLRVTIKEPPFYYQNQEYKVYLVKSIERGKKKEFA